MKRILISSLIGITLVSGIVSTASAEPKFGSRTWWEQQANNG